MTFPAVECKFSRLVQTPTELSALVRIYRVDDGGLDALGNQVYVRTLKFERGITAPPATTSAQLVNAARTRLTQWAVDMGYQGLTADRLLCSL